MDKNLDSLLFYTNGNSFMCNTTNGIAINTTDPQIKEKLYSDNEYRMESMAQKQFQSIPEDLKNEYCLMMGTNILFHSKDYIEVQQKYQEFINHHILTTIYSPSSIN